MTKQEALEWLTDLIESYAIVGSYEAALVIAVDCIRESMDRDNPRGIWPDNDVWVCEVCHAVMAVDKPKPWKYCPWCGERVKMLYDDEDGGEDNAT